VQERKFPQQMIPFSASARRSLPSSPRVFSRQPTQIPSVSGPQPDWFGRAVYQVSTTALDAHSETCDLFFEVDARRFYVAGYMAVPQEAGRVLGDPVLSRATAEGIAREFAARRYPTPLKQLELVTVRGPLPPQTGGPPVFTFHWSGLREALETGDRLIVSVSAITGDVLGYLCFAAAGYTEDDVRVREADAVDAVRSLIEQRGGADTNALRYVTMLVLSHGQTADDGPVWRVIAIRPATAEGGDDLRFLRYVGARSGEVIEPPMHEMLDALFFGALR